MALFAFPYLFVFYFLGFKMEGLIVIPIVFTLIFSLFLNRYGFYLLSKCISIFCVNLGLLFYSISLGSSFGIQLVFFTLSMVPLIIFELRHRLIIFITCIIPVILFLGLEFFGFNQFLITPDSDYSSLIYISMIFLYQN